MREKIKLVSSAKTGHYYTTTKNKRLHPDKVEVKKFDPVVRKHVNAQNLIKDSRNPKMKMQSYEGIIFSCLKSVPLWKRNWSRVSRNRR